MVNEYYVGFLVGDKAYIKMKARKGKIDKIQSCPDLSKGKGGMIHVTDLKTGKAFKNFEIKSIKKEAKNDDWENIKKHNYKQQLMFYKILLENSKSYKDKDIKTGILSFVDDENISEISLDFENDISREEWKDFEKLIVNVYKIIKDIDKLSNIDISKYEANINGILVYPDCSVSVVIVFMIVLVGKLTDAHRKCVQCREKFRFPGDPRGQRFKHEFLHLNVLAAREVH
jgi:hypothetical protein